MSVGRINLALVILAVAIVLLPAAEGYAAPTGSSTTVINNDSQVSAGYFTVSLFLKDGEGNYNPISATVLNRGAVGYNEDGGNKTLVDGTYPISVSSLYMMITEYNVPYSGTHTYSASSTVTLTDNQTPISGISSSIVLKDGEDSCINKWFGYSRSGNERMYWFSKQLIICYFCSNISESNKINIFH